MDWRVLAGFVDGEGSICLSRGGCYRYKDVPRVPTYRPWLAISNNHRGVLELTCDFVGAGHDTRPSTEQPQSKAWIYVSSARVLYRTGSAKSPTLSHHQETPG